MLRLRSQMGQRVFITVNGETLEILVNNVNGRSVELGFSGPQTFRILSERNYLQETKQDKQESDPDNGPLWKGGRDNSGNL